MNRIKRFDSNMRYDEYAVIMCDTVLPWFQFKNRIIDTHREIDWSFFNTTNSMLLNACGSVASHFGTGKCVRLDRDHIEMIITMYNFSKTNPLFTPAAYTVIPLIDAINSYLMDRSIHEGISK